MIGDEDTDSWLETLKPGDLVAIDKGRWGTKEYRFYAVEKVTKLHIILKDGEKYRKLNGYNIHNNGLYQHDRIEQITPEIKDARRRGKLLTRIKDQKWTDLSTEVLAKVVEALPAPVAAEEPK